VQQRVPIVRASCVRVLVGGQAAGTGFVVRAGLVLTCYHVVQLITPVPGQPGTFNFGYQPQITVEFPGMAPTPATVHASCQGPANLRRSVERDFTILVSANPPAVPPLPIGAFGAVAEGASVYVCGYPLTVAQAIVAVGILSTKWSAPNYRLPGTRDAAWLDVTMNSGNSGGPVIMRGATPTDDRVIGIATFNLNPFGDTAAEILAGANAGGGGSINGIDLRRLFGLVGQGFLSNSLGVGGCVAIDYAAQVLNTT
jgi:serine protease Do